MVLAAGRAAEHDLHLRWRIADAADPDHVPPRITTPSRASRSSTIAAHSGSSSASGAALSSTVTCGAEPAKCLRQLEAGRAGADHDQMLRASREFESRVGGQIRRGSRPGIGGSAGAEPVAMTKRRALISMSSPAATRRRVVEARRALDHAHAEAGDALLRFIRRAHGE